MSTSRVFVALFLIMLAAVGLVPPVSADDSEDQFGLGSLEGAWGFNAWGEGDGNGTSVVGRLTFDGEGKCTGTAILIHRGDDVEELSITGPKGSCSYTVDLDGTGIIDVAFIDPFDQSVTVTVYFTIVDDENELRFSAIRIKPGFPATIVTGVAKRQTTTVNLAP